MDEICAWLERTARWIDCADLPVIPWAGWAAGRLRNPPAPHVEIIYIQKGGIDPARVGDRLVRYRQGHVTFNNIHFGAEGPATVPETRAWCLFLDVRGVPAMADLARRPVFAQMPVRNAAMLEAICDRVTQRSRFPGVQHPAYPYGPPAYEPNTMRYLGTAPRLHLKAAVLELLSHLLDEAGPTRQNEHEHPEPILLALDYIDRHYGKANLSLTQLAKAAHLSADHFGRLFRRSVGVAPLHYLRQLRIRQSCLLLTHSPLTITQIAREVGYRDPLHFSRVFRNDVGVSPSGYRPTEQRHDPPMSQA